MMFGIKSRDADAPTSSLPRVTADRPELWTPYEVQADYPAARATVDESVTLITAGDWLGEMRGEGVMSQHPERAGILGEHLAHALGAIEYDGVIPGRVHHPGVMTTWVTRPAKLVTGEDSLVFSEWVLGEPSDEHKAQLGLYYWSEEKRDEFLALLDTTIADVLRNSDRAWETYRHIRAIQEAHRIKDAREKAARQKARFDAEHLCPVCEKHGAVAVRHVALYTDKSPGINSKVPRMRSCRDCWAEAVDQLRARNAAVQLADGRTRAGAVSDWLDQNQGG
ncbi:hypothetical protein ACQ143_02430 [Microbacterium sp. MC2]